MIFRELNDQRKPPRFTPRRSICNVGYKSLLLPLLIGTVKPQRLKLTRPVELIEKGPIRVPAERWAS
jgi:hypothetical protein